MRKPKIGAVSYLNTKPLVHGIEKTAADYDIVYDLPSNLADRLLAGELDVALIPVVEALSNPNYTVVSNAAIGCHGPVRSVKIVSRVPVADIKSISMDEGSRTSVALTKVILSKRHGASPDCEDLPIHADWATVTTDAALIIGDRAMHPLVNESSRAQGFLYEWDLGAVWNEWTGLPFVFAVWAARSDSNLAKLGVILTTCRDSGVENIRSIAQNWAGTYNLSDVDCYHYLSRHLHFYLGQNEKLGLDRFIELASQLNLFSHNTSLQFHDCQSAG